MFPKYSKVISINRDGIVWPWRPGVPKIQGFGSLTTQESSPSSPAQSGPSRILAQSATCFPHSYISCFCLTMYAYRHSTPESGRCGTCNQFFIYKASLTKHHRNCLAACKLSKKLWRNGMSNIKKLNMSQMASQKQAYTEFSPVKTTMIWNMLSNPHVELVSTLHIFPSFMIIHIHLIFIGCAAWWCCFGANGAAPF